MPLPYVRATPTPTMMSWREGWEEKGKGRERERYIYVTVGECEGESRSEGQDAAGPKVELSILNKNIEDGESWIIVGLYY